MSDASETFQEVTQEAVVDFDYRRWMQSALAGYEKTRAVTQARFGDWQAARRAAAQIKWEALENLDRYLERFVDNFEKRGGRVFWATDAAAARDEILRILREREARSVIKSKCMTSEEIHLNETLEAEGFEVVESDLGEYIVQLRKEAPYHFVFPAMHLRRGQIRDDFHRELGSEMTDDPEALTLIARQALRRKYLEADVGFSGANFAVAETGMISITENEGNARLTCAMPKVHIALMGIEKVIPTLDDLALLLPMLATAGTGQHLTGYNSQYGGPALPGEPDGPEAFHLILLDNHRTRLLAEPAQRDALRCIRCGACLNVCPIFKNVGGHSYGTTYQGPIGSVITPHLRGLQDWGHLSQASSLCGACTETCPVRIDLHHHLLRNRSAAMKGSNSYAQKMIFRLWAAVMKRPGLFQWAGRMGRFQIRCTRPFAGSLLDPLRKWRKTRDLPDPPRGSFRDWWKGRGS